VNAAPPLRTVLVGFGSAGRTIHAPLIHAADGLTLTGVVTSDAERAAAARATAPRATIWPTLQDALDGDTFDLAVVATANAVHVPQARLALRRGLHVVVDKPVAGDAPTAAALVEEAERAGRQLHVFQNRRWDSDFRTLQGVVADGRLGTVHRVESRFERWRPDAPQRWREAGDPAQLGGLLYDLMSHLVDQMLLLLGPARAVYAERDARREPTGSDDDTFIAIRHRSGAVSHCWAGALVAVPGPRFRALGSRAAWTVQGVDGQEQLLRAGASPDRPDWGHEDAARRSSLLHPAGTVVPLAAGRWDAYYPAVVASVRGQAPAPVAPAEVLATMRVLDAARESAATGQTLTLGNEVDPSPA
jgi:predicted dehydrogenase